MAHRACCRLCCPLQPGAELSKQIQTVPIARICIERIKAGQQHRSGAGVEARPKLNHVCVCLSNPLCKVVFLLLACRVQTVGAMEPFHPRAFHKTGRTRDEGEKAGLSKSTNECLTGINQLQGRNWQATQESLTHQPSRSMPMPQAMPQVRGTGCVYVTPMRHLSHSLRSVQPPYSSGKSALIFTAAWNRCHC